MTHGGFGKSKPLFYSELIEHYNKMGLSLVYANKTRQIKEDAYELGAMDRLLQNK